MLKCCYTEHHKHSFLVNQVPHPCHQMLAAQTGCISNFFWRFSFLFKQNEDSWSSWDPKFSIQRRRLRSGEVLLGVWVFVWVVSLFMNELHYFHLDLRSFCGKGQLIRHRAGVPKQQWSSWSLVYSNYEFSSSNFLFLFHYSELSMNKKQERKNEKRTTNRPMMKGRHKVIQLVIYHLTFSTGEQGCMKNKSISEKKNGPSR